MEKFKCFSFFIKKSSGWIFFFLSQNHTHKCSLEKLELEIQPYFVVARRKDTSIHVDSYNAFLLLFISGSRGGGICNGIS